jgi:hypothetical protein
MTTIDQLCSLETSAHEHPYAADGYIIFDNHDGTYTFFHRHQPPPSVPPAAVRPSSVSTPHFPLTEADARVATICIGCDQLKDPACLVCWTCWADWCPKHPQPLQQYTRSFENWKSELTTKEEEMP